jgi:predicted deacylase
LFAIAGTKTGHLDVLRLGQWLHLQPVSKAAVFREFMAPLDLEEEIVARDAEVALAFLVEQGMVEVAGDTITVPASFWNGGQVPAT